MNGKLTGRQREEIKEEVGDRGEEVVGVSVET